MTLPDSLRFIQGRDCLSTGRFTPAWHLSASYEGKSCSLFYILLNGDLDDASVIVMSDEDATPKIVMTLQDHLADLSRILNVKVAKKVSFVLIVTLFVLNVLNYVDYGFDPCRGILSSGRLVDKSEGVWQPHGCMLHKYKTADSLSCLQLRKIAFVGDSRMRELMFEFLRTINPSYNIPEGKIHSDITFTEDKLKLEFIWLPELNKTALDLYESWTDDKASRPDVVFQAAATHTIKKMNGSDEALKEYTTNFTALVIKMTRFASISNTRLFWIMQEPVFKTRLSTARKMITDEQLTLYNEAVRTTLYEYDLKRDIKLIESFALLSSELMDLSHDGLHLPVQALKIESHILVNFLCNDLIRPIDGSCCQSSPYANYRQKILGLVGLLLFAGALTFTFLRFKKKQCSSKRHEELMSNGAVGQDVETLLPQETKKEPGKTDTIVEITIALAKYSLIMFYFFVCDRTNIFMKANKHFTNARFFLPLLYVMSLGLFGIVPTSQSSFLNRDQTDEWKGWMQLIILIYHMSGASVNVPIYMHIRILVGMYLFMTGYGHFSYFWHKGDYGIYRVLNVVFRLNFLTVSLCLVMDRLYQFYYFVPLCTFWFLVLYVSMAFWPRANIKLVQQNGSGDGILRNFGSPYFVMFLKLVGTFVAITTLFVSQRYYEVLFSWWPAVHLFELPEGSVREWWFRCHLDRYAMLHGAVFCFIYIILKKLTILDDSKQGCLLSIRSSFITLTVSILAILSYVVWATQCTDKAACNRVHSYASIIPVTSFILIRNVPGYLRSAYSAFFAWFGRISLELFIGQYHIWLAADTKGMLVVLSPDWPTLNLVVTSFVFVCVAHEINKLTGIITKHFLGPPNISHGKLLIRFALLFLIMWGLSVPEYFLSA